MQAPMSPATFQPIPYLPKPNPMILLGAFLVLFGFLTVAAGAFYYAATDATLGTLRISPLILALGGVVSLLIGLGLFLALLGLARRQP